MRAMDSIAASGSAQAVASVASASTIMPLTRSATLESRSRTICVRSPAKARSSRASCSACSRADVRSRSSIIVRCERMTRATTQSAAATTTLGTTLATPRCQ